MAAPALLIAAASALNTGANWAAQGSMNRKTRKWNEHMYNVQRQHSIEDWNRVNEYNSPINQMARFEAAGLNPNLIYGQMHEAGPIRGNNVDSWNPQAPRFNMDESIRDSIATYQDARLKEAQIDLSREYIETQQQEQKLKEAQQLGTIAATAKSWADTGSAQFRLEMEKALKDYSLQAAKLANEKTESEIGKIGADVSKVIADTMYTNDQNRRAQAQELRNQAMHGPNLKVAVQQWLNSQLQGRLTEKQISEMNKRLDLLDYDREFKMLEAEFRRKGMTLSDPWWLRTSQNILKKLWPGAIQ